MMVKMIKDIRKRMEAKIEKMQGKFTKAYKNWSGHKHQKESVAE